MPNRIWLCGDTHMHSSISDGKYTPDELIEKCKTKEAVDQLCHDAVMHGMWYKPY